KLMRKETEINKGIEISKDEWRKGTILLFEMHHYFTDYCQLLLNDKKSENLERLKAKAAEKEGSRSDGGKTKAEHVESDRSKQSDKTKQAEKNKQAEKPKQPEKKDDVVPVIPGVYETKKTTLESEQAKKKKEEK